jgi:chlorophyll synthase
VKKTSALQAQHLWLHQETKRHAFSPETTNLQDNNDDNSLWNSETRQILGLKDPAETTELWKIRLQLAKPISWVPLSVLVLCGAIASGHFQWNTNNNDPQIIDRALDIVRVMAAMILAGPCSEGFAQTINDWYDRDIDAINEPYRPIPAGKITPAQVMEQLRGLFLAGMAIAIGLDATATALPEQPHGNIPMVTAIAIVGYIISYLYSAPPVKLKQNGITGDLAICICYIAFPFWVGQAVFQGLHQPVDWLL